MLTAALLACALRPGAAQSTTTFVTSLSGLGSVPIGLTPLSWPGVSVVRVRGLWLLSGAARAAQAARCCCTVLRRVGGACRCAGVGVVCTRATRANAGADSPSLQMTLHLLNTTDPLAVCNE